ncbi:MAG: DEAD/DEAH box helicase [Pseudomonadota bacterium]|nr:DEAD/DEAH box helicase [Pseudomonadota bacterium]
MPFAALGLSPALARAASELGYSTPTPIQSHAIPAILRGADLLGSAQTGSGKTAAFGLPLLQRLQDDEPHAPRRLRGLVLVPTRELAAQVGEVLRRLGRNLPLPPKIAIVFGGVSINPQMMGLRGGADLVVATPGRLLDLLEHNALTLSSVEVLVLDEADRLLDLGFSEELQRLLALLPAGRQNLFFSATFASDVQALAGSLLRDPVRIEVAPTAANHPAVLQRVIQVDPDRRTQLLRHLLHESGWDRVLVFVATRYAAEHVAWKLHQAGVFATPFHGDLSQGKRAEVLAQFKNEQWDVVVTTDLAARGIDIAQLPVVVNYDLPRSAVGYVHRIGRTGRAGEPGLAVSFVAGSDQRLVADIEKLLKSRIELEPLEFDEDTPRISVQGRINDGRRMYREGGDSSAPAPRESREPRERRERREYMPHRASSASRDPFFDKPYEPSAPAQGQPAWEAAQAAPARSSVSANIKTRKKVAALFKAAS